MKRLMEKRKSVGSLAYCSKDKEDAMESLPIPYEGARRKSSLNVLSSLISPTASQQKPAKSQRRYSIASLVLRNSQLKPSTTAPPILLPLQAASEADYLPGLSPLVDFSPGYFSFSDGADCTVVAESGRRSLRWQCMGRAMRVVVLGSRRVGKTAVLRQVACVEDITQQPYSPTLEDTYQVLLEEADRPREILIFHDTAGLPDHGPIELKRAHLQVADAFVLVYSVADHESFNRVDLLKKYIEKQFGKERKDVPIVVLGNMREVPNRKVDREFAMSWAAREKVKLFEVSAKDRSTLVDFVHYLGQRHFHPIKESKFSLSKKLKSEKSNAAILMDF